MRKLIALLTLLVALGVVNASIYHHERHLAEGEVVYLRLMPVDPRSLMQGDYMALRFELHRSIRQELRERQGAVSDWPRSFQGQVVVALDEQGVAHFRRLGHDKALSEHERLVDFRVRAGEVRVATDAFFFQEGTGEHYQRATHGRFRLADGEFLLTGLVDDNLRLLGEVLSPPALEGGHH